MEQYQIDNFIASYSLDTYLNLDSFYKINKFTLEEIESILDNNLLFITSINLKNKLKFDLKRVLRHKKLELIYEY